MNITDIVEIRLLPPLAIGRFGSSPSPMDNYRLEINDPIGARKIKPAPTLLVDEQSGAITALTQPEVVSFRDAMDRIRPVSPFIEAWARFDENSNLVPLTLDHLNTLGIDVTQVEWSVEVGNLKAFRRTGDPKDKILAGTGWFSDHNAHELKGECPNFIDGKSMSLGSVRFIRPTPEFPQIRFRFTPSPGAVYGPPPGGVGEHSDRHPPYPPEQQIYDRNKGRWDGYADRGNDRRITNPGGIYAQFDDGVSKGYLDDACDGIVSLRLTLTPASTGTSRTLTAMARIASGPPTFAPDSKPVRTIAHELEQALLGPEAELPQSLEEAAALVAEAREIVRRALETVRLMNVEMLNRASSERGVGMARMDFLDVGRRLEPIMDPAVADATAIRARHERVLLALESGTLAWFAKILRRPEEVGDLTNEGRRRMPALMRGADGRHLALTRRQISIIERAAAAGLAARSAASTAVAETARAVDQVKLAARVDYRSRDAVGQDEAQRRE